MDLYLRQHSNYNENSTHKTYNKLTICDMIGAATQNKCAEEYVYLNIHTKFKS